MEIENIKLSISAKEELEQFDKALSDFNKFTQLKKAAIKIGVQSGNHTDCSGDCIQYQYKEGNFHPMYVEILEFARKKFEDAKEKLIAEINNL